MPVTDYCSNQPLVGATVSLNYAAVVTAINVTGGGSGYTSAPTVTITGVFGLGSGAKATATVAGGKVTAVTVSDPGAGYTQGASASFTGGGGTGATATATTGDLPTGTTCTTIGQVTGATITAGGSGYTSAPTVTIIGGGGSGATATATLSGGRITALTVTSGGANYTAQPAVSFVRAPGDTTGSGASAVSIVRGPVVALNLTNGGSGFTSAPTVSITGGGGTGATATATVANGQVTGLTLTAGGSNYTPVVAVSITGGGGTGATATTTINGSLTGFSLVNGGSLYTSPPTIVLTGGGGTGGSATATVATTGVGSVTVTAGGTGFTSTPAVAFSGGGGTGAAANATWAAQCCAAIAKAGSYKASATAPGYSTVTSAATSAACAGNSVTNIALLTPYQAPIAYTIQVAVDRGCVTPIGLESGTGHSGVNEQGDGSGLPGTRLDITGPNGYSASGTAEFGTDFTSLTGFTFSPPGPGTYTITAYKSQRYVTLTGTVALPQLVYPNCKANVQISFCLGPAPAYVCGGPCLDPLNRTLHLTDSVVGSIDLTYDPNVYLGWVGSITYDYPGCAGGTNSVPCPTQPGLVVRYLFGGTAVAPLNISYNIHHPASTGYNFGCPDQVNGSAQGYGPDTTDLATCPPGAPYWQMRIANPINNPALYCNTLPTFTVSE